MNLPNIKQTKFLLAAFILVMATLMAIVSMVAQWHGKAMFLDATAWWGIGGTILALYNVGHVTDTHLQQKKNVPADQRTD